MTQWGKELAQYIRRQHCRLKTVFKGLLQLGVVPMPSSPGNLCFSNILMKQYVDQQSLQRYKNRMLSHWAENHWSEKDLEDSGRYRCHWWHRNHLGGGRTGILCLYPCARLKNTKSVLRTDSKVGHYVKNSMSAVVSATSFRRFHVSSCRRCWEGILKNMQIGSRPWSSAKTME